MMGYFNSLEIGNVRKFKSNMRLMFKSMSLIVVVMVYLIMSNINIFDDNNTITTRRLEDGCVEPASPKWVAIFYTLGILWLFLALAIVADEYFVPALDVIAEEWKLSPDVAGATLLAAGGSAPELFTNLSAVIQNSSSTGFGASKTNTN
jgi:Ca2+/H+ antiporter